MSLVRRPGKINLRLLQVIGEKSEVLGNILRYKNFSKSAAFWLEESEKCMWKFLYKETVAEWGKPNVQINCYESAPGLWTFDDLELDISWHIYSDLHHKRAWKGTSIECQIRSEITDDQMLESLKKLVPLLKGLVPIANQEQAIPARST